MSESTEVKEPGEPVSAAEERQANAWKLFESVNRVLSAYFFDRNKHNLDMAVLPESLARGAYYQRDETTWDSFRAACEIATDEEIRQALGFFKAKEAPPIDWEPETLVDAFQAGGSIPGLAVTGANEDRSPPAIRDTTRDLIQAILFDTWPHSEAIADFGLTSQAHYEALYYPVRNREITAQALDAALGKGDELTALVRSAPSNPHRDIAFRTARDELMTPFQGLEGGWPQSGVRNPDRDDLLLETHRLSREVGYVGFRDEYFDDPDVIAEWPDPAVRERELRTFWDKAGESALASYKVAYANDSADFLTVHRDRLRDLLAGEKDAQIAFYQGDGARGRVLRMQSDGAEDGSAEGQPLPSPESIEIDRDGVPDTGRMAKAHRRVGA
jgi:hypothetical protein